MFTKRLKHGKGKNESNLKMSTSACHDQTIFETYTFLQSSDRSNLISNILIYKGGFFKSTI